MSAGREKTEAQLREFGQVMTLACLIFAGVGIWKRGYVSVTATVLMILAGAFIGAALTAPTKLRGIERRWMIFAEKLSVVMTWVLMTLTFFLIITPVGVMLRLFGKDLLGLAVNRATTTYWEPIDPQGPGSRHTLPY